MLVAGGQTGTDVAGDPFRSIASAELYDAATRTWSATGAMGDVRQHHTAAVLASGNVLVAGGEDRRAFVAASAELYDPVLGTWSPTGAMSSARRSHTATILPNGHVLAVGGTSGTGLSEPVFSSAEIYDPLAGTWSDTASMAAERTYHTASALLDGTVLVAGGSGTFPTSWLASAEIFDPISGAWSPTSGSMALARYFHSASVLATGQVLIVGGTVPGNSNTGTAELFKTPPALPCASAAQCASGFCVDGVCCNTPCAGVCQACTSALRGGGTDGLCGPIAKGIDPQSECTDDGAPVCTKDGVCDGKGACESYAKSPGCAPRACTADSQCTSGFCVDGVCCNARCDGACRACTGALKGAGADGVCGPIVGDADTSAACHGIDAGGPPPLDGGDASMPPLAGDPGGSGGTGSGCSIAVDRTETARTPMVGLMLGAVLMLRARRRRRRRSGRGPGHPTYLARAARHGRQPRISPP